MIPEFIIQQFLGDSQTHKHRSFLLYILRLTLTSLPDGRVKLELGQKNRAPFAGGLLAKGN